MSLPPLSSKNFYFIAEIIFNMKVKANADQIIEIFRAQRKDMIPHDVRRCLNNMVDHKHLTLNEGIYSLSNSFVKYLSEKHGAESPTAPKITPPPYHVNVFSLPPIRKSKIPSAAGRRPGIDVAEDRSFCAVTSNVKIQYYDNF